MTFLADFWREWETLFRIVPFGDPYLAWSAVLVLYFPVRKFIRHIF